MGNNLKTKKKQPFTDTGHSLKDTLGIYCQLQFAHSEQIAIDNIYQEYLSSCGTIVLVDFLA